MLQREVLTIRITCLVIIYFVQVCNYVLFITISMNTCFLLTNKHNYLAFVIKMRPVSSETGVEFLNMV
jgi:hypothetical protein